MSGAWPLEVRRGSVHDMHDLRPDGGPALWWCLARRPAVVLGSNQPAAEVDEDAAHRLGLEVVRRRSGGTAVILVPDDVVWIDVVAPIGVGSWGSDVRASMSAVGAVWSTALAELGVRGEVYDGPLAPGRQRQVCFAGRGPGELFDRAGAKLVGLSQRRTATHLRIQGMCHLRWDAALNAAVLRADAASLGALVACVPADAAEVVDAVVAASAVLASHA